MHIEASGFPNRCAVPHLASFTQKYISRTFPYQFITVCCFFLLLRIIPFSGMHNLFNSTANSSQSFIEAKHASVHYSVNTARIFFFFLKQVSCGSQAPRWLLIILFCCLV